MRLLAVGAVAAGAVALLPGVASAALTAASKGSVNAPGPALETVSLKKNVLGVKASCVRASRVVVASKGRRLGATGHACHHGRFKARLKLHGPRPVAGQRLRITVSDATGSNSTDLEVSRPGRGRKPGGGVEARAAANGLWNGGGNPASSFCTYFGGSKRHEVKVNSETFGYRINTRLNVRAVLGLYTPGVGEKWYFGVTAPHEAGMSTVYVPGWGLVNSAVWSWTVTGSRFYTRSYIEVIGGDWNFVRVSTGPYYYSPYWCYWP